MELSNLSLIDLIHLLDSKAVSSFECVSYFADRISKFNPKLNAFVATDIEAALTRAKEIDHRRAHNRAVGALGGIPFGVKDLEDAAGFRTTMGSALFADSSEAVTNSHMVEKLTFAGGIVIGKTNTPEFGWKSETFNKIFGPTRNPHDLTRSCGGSSGGTAAAIAAGIIPLATGSDGGGSLRIPAAACGISAMKTSLGRIPSISDRPGGWHDLSVPGPMARNILDTAYLLDLVVMPDGRDFRSQGRKFESWVQEISSVNKTFRVAYSKDLGYSPIDPEIEQVISDAVSQLSDAGMEVVEIDSLFDKDPIDEFYIMTMSYYAKMLQPLLDDPKFQLVEPGIQEQVTKGLSFSAIDFLRATDLCFYMNRTLFKLFQQFDVLISPTTAGLPPKIGGMPSIGGIEGPDWVKLTYPFNMTRSPAASIFAGYGPSKLPIGLQIVGPHLGDLTVLAAARKFEQILGVSSPALTGSQSS